VPRLRTACLAVVVSAVLSACGGASNGGTEVDPSAVGTPDADGVLRVVGTDNLQWDPPALSAPAGEVLFALQCEERVNHNLVVGDDRTVVAECGPGGSDQGALELAAGTYPFVCTIPGHEARMRGTLTVE